MASLSTSRGMCLAGPSGHVQSLHAAQTRADTRRDAWPVGAQDFGQTDIRAAEFLINGRKLYLAAADAGQTLRLWSYEQHAQSWGGKRLLPLCALLRCRGHWRLHLVAHSGSAGPT